MNDSGAQGHFCCARDHRFELLGIPGADDSGFQDLFHTMNSNMTTLILVITTNLSRKLCFFDGAKSFPSFFPRLSSSGEEKLFGNNALVEAGIEIV